MSFIIAVLAGPIALWLVSRAAISIIDRVWAPLGRTMRIDGLPIHVLDVPAERADAPALVLIHGASGNLRDPLEALREALDNRFRLIALDRPGHGHSARGPRAMSDPALQADLIAAALDRLDAPPCLVFGHSWGAAVAAALALRHPPRVAGLVLVAPATHPWPGGISRRTRLFALPYVGRILAELVVIPLGLAVIDRVVRTIFAPDPVPAGYRSRIGAPLAIRPKTFVAGCRDIVDLYAHLVRLSARYDEIAVPTEIVTGDRDRVVAPAIHAYGLARDIPHAQLTVLPGAGHMPHWSRTADVVAATERVADAARGAGAAAA